MATKASIVLTVVCLILIATNIARWREDVANGAKMEALNQTLKSTQERCR